MEAVDLYHCSLQDYLYRLTRQWQDAEDILQELWKYVVVHFPEDKITSLSLLRRKAYQLFVDRYRAAKRRPELLTDNVPETLHAEGETCFTEATEQGMKEKFWQEFPGIDLSDAQKDVLWLHARYGYTYQEIQDRCGLASSTVGDWIAQGRRRLADYLNTQP